MSRNGDDRWHVTVKQGGRSDVYRARVVIGADGVETMVGRWAGLDGLLQFLNPWRWRRPTLPRDIRHDDGTDTLRPDLTAATVTNGETPAPQDAPEPVTASIPARDFSDGH